MIDITIHDEVNCQFSGLSLKDRLYIVEKTELPVPGAFQSAAFKTGNWNGKESHFDGSTGITFNFMIDRILSILVDDLGYDIDSDFNLIDERIDYQWDDRLSHVDRDFLMEETGFPLRDHQEVGINQIIDNKQGILQYATSSGKSLISLGISKVFDPYLKSIVIVPSENLVKQTFADYQKSNLNCFAMTPKVKPKDREKTFEQYDHIIITAKLFLNCLDYVREKPYVVIVDEAHKGIGPALGDALRFEMCNAPIRVGLSATIPTKDKLKREMIFCHIGNGILDEVKAKELTDKGYAANVSIEMIHTIHEEMEEYSESRDDRGNRVWEWDMERSYLDTHKGRVEALADFIKSLDVKNTLVLCHPQLGKNLCQYFDGRVVVDETDTDVRQEWYSEFDEGDDTLLFCSWETAGTGLSINRVHRLIMLDVGKNEARIIQGIGRGMRLSENNDIEVLDISARTYYSGKHEKERLKIYKRDQYPYVISTKSINVY